MIAVFVSIVKSCFWAVLFWLIVQEWYVPLIVFPLSLAVDLWILRQLMDYDFDELPEREREVLGFIAVNQDRGHPRTALKFLMDRELIRECEDGYFVPLPVHIAWCEWCSKNYKEEDEEIL